jgi:hypothetical protein
VADVRVWVAIWVGSTAICGRIGAWIGKGPLPRLTGLALAAGFAKGLPHTTTLAWLTAAAWLATAIALGLRSPALTAPDDDGQEAALTPERVTAALHELAAPHVQLAPLAEALDSTTQDVRTVLEEMGVPVAGGVRMKGRGVSTGVRADDLPPLSPAAAPGTEGALTSDNNSNNGEESGPQKGLGGRYRFWVTDDPKNPARARVHHR